MKNILGVVDAARAVAETYAGGAPVAVVTIVGGPGAGRRLLVHLAGGAPGSISGTMAGGALGTGLHGMVATHAAAPSGAAGEGSIAVSGTLGHPALDAAARDLGLRALGAGSALLETVSLQPNAEVSAPPAPGATPDTPTAGAPAPASITLFAEAHHPPEELVIVGAGHIAVPLAEFGVRLGYRVVVLDDREEFATAERFPPEATVLRTDFADPFHAVRIDARSHLVLVTRAHRYDYDCLLHLLRGAAVPRYIGMIGSRRRVRATFQALLDAGIPRERIALVRAPVGLEIGAETPAEIAVSVVAELVMLRRGTLAAAPIAERERVLERLLPAADHQDGPHEAQDRAAGGRARSMQAGDGRADNVVLQPTRATEGSHG